jgi:hypothetical protein
VSYSLFSYDSDVAHEKNIDYGTKIFNDNPAEKPQLKGAVVNEEPKAKLQRDTKTAPLLAASSASDKHVKGMI